MKAKWQMIYQKAKENFEANIDKRSKSIAYSLTGNGYQANPPKEPFSTSPPIKYSIKSSV
jgi:hypothetical protein